MLVNTVERHSDSVCGGLQFVIERCQRQAAPHRQFQVGGIVDGQSVRTGQAQGGVMKSWSASAW